MPAPQPTPSAPKPSPVTPTAPKPSGGGGFFDLASRLDTSVSFDQVEAVAPAPAPNLKIQGSEKLATSEVKDIVKEIRTINDNNGLTGSLRYNEVSNSQLKELQSYMRDLSLTSKELFEKYGSEVQ